MLTRFAILLRTTDDRVLTIARIVLGSVMFAHGAQKALGWFGGAGFGPTLNYFGQNLGIPAPLAVLAIAAEFLGGLFLILGLLGRLSALGIAVNMTVAALLVHLPYGFFMNWFGAKAGEGIEYHILVLALASLIVVRGSGAWSLDRLLSDAMQAHLIGDSFQAGSATMPRIVREFWMWVAQYQRRL
jgi:putative oxidoreductase